MLIPTTLSWPFWLFLPWHNCFHWPACLGSMAELPPAPLTAEEDFLKWAVACCETSTSWGPGFMNPTDWWGMHWKTCMIKGQTDIFFHVGQWWVILILMVMMIMNDDDDDDDFEWWWWFWMMMMTMTKTTRWGANSAIVVISWQGLWNLREKMWLWMSSLLTMFVSFPSRRAPSKKAKSHQHDKNKPGCKIQFDSYFEQ